jgi:hypothetical protein
MGVLALKVFYNCIGTRERIRCSEGKQNILSFFSGFPKKKKVTGSFESSSATGMICQVKLIGKEKKITVFLLRNIGHQP